MLIRDVQFYGKLLGLKSSCQGTSCNRGKEMLENIVYVAFIPSGGRDGDLRGAEN